MQASGWLFLAWKISEPKARLAEKKPTESRRYGLSLPVVSEVAERSCRFDPRARDGDVDPSLTQACWGTAEGKSTKAALVFRQRPYCSRIRTLQLLALLHT